MGTIGWVEILEEIRNRKRVDGNQIKARYIGLEKERSIEVI